MRLARLALQAVFLQGEDVSGVLLEYRGDERGAPAHGELVSDFVLASYIQARPETPRLESWIPRWERVSWKDNMGNDVLLVFLDPLRVELIECLQRKLEIGNQRIAARLGKVLAHNDSDHLHLFRVRGHGVSGHNPASLTKLMGTKLSQSGIPGRMNVEVKLTRRIHRTPFQGPRRYGKQREEDRLHRAGS